MKDDESQREDESEGEGISREEEIRSAVLEKLIFGNLEGLKKLFADKVLTLAEFPLDLLTPNDEIGLIIPEKDRVSIYEYLSEQFSKASMEVPAVISALNPVVNPVHDDKHSELIKGEGYLPRPVFSQDFKTDIVSVKDELEDAPLIHMDDELPEQEFSREDKIRSAVFEQLLAGNVRGLDRLFADRILTLAEFPLDLLSLEATVKDRIIPEKDRAAMYEYLSGKFISASMEIPNELKELDPKINPVSEEKPTRFVQSARTYLPKAVVKSLNLEKLAGLMKEPKTIDDLKIFLREKKDISMEELRDLIKDPINRGALKLLHNQVKNFVNRPMSLEEITSMLRPNRYEKALSASPSDHIAPLDERHAEAASAPPDDPLASSVKSINFGESFTEEPVTRKARMAAIAMANWQVPQAGEEAMVADHASVGSSPGSDKSSVVSSITLSVSSSSSLEAPIKKEIPDALSHAVDMYEMEKPPRAGRNRREAINFGRLLTEAGVEVAQGDLGKQTHPATVGVKKGPQLGM